MSRTHPSLEYLLVGVRRRGRQLPADPARARASPSRWGAVARPRDRDVHAVATPRMGGVALFVGFALALFVGRPAADPERARSHSGPEMALDRRRRRRSSALLGVLDDRYELDSLTKLAGQVLATGIMVTLGGVQLADSTCRGRHRHGRASAGTWPSR